MNDQRIVEVGTLVSFPSYNGKIFYGEVETFFDGPGPNPAVYAMAVGPWGRKSHHVTEHCVRSCAVDDLTILDTPRPAVDDVWTTTQGKRTWRVLVLTVDGFMATCESLLTGRYVGMICLAGNGWHPDA